MPEALPSQQLISIDQIKDGVIILKGGGLRRVLLASGLNFELKSEEEKNSSIIGLQQMLYGLDFSLEFVVHSRRINIDNYLKRIDEIVSQESNELLRIQGEEYIKFIRSFVELYGVMEKKFFVIVPFDPVEISPQAIKGQLKIAIQKRPPQTALFKYSAEDFERYRAQLETRVTQISNGLARIGIKTIPLGTEELIELFYNIYNPAAREKHLAES